MDGAVVAPASPEASAAVGLATEQPDPLQGAVVQRRSGVAERPVQEQSPARSSASGSTPSSSGIVPGPAGGRGSIARLLIRMSWLATATNELMLLIRSCSIVASASR